jgi:hypothetical protein
METPDKWIVLKIGKENPIYKVFASWYGGYLGSDSWKMNSGIKSVNIHEDDYVDFIGYSGSVYRCVIGCYGTNRYSQGVLTNVIEGAKKQFVDVEVMSENTDWKELFSKD